MHLVRDPRAMITSITKRPGTWGDALRNATFQCRRMQEDSRLEEVLPRERYVRVRYEDLVEETSDTLAGLYHHLGLPFTEHVQRVAFARTHAENITGTKGSERVTSLTIPGRRSSVQVISEVLRLAAGNSWKPTTTLP